jgi:hypothetical protein
MTTTLKHKGTPVEFSIGTLLVPPLSLAFIEENMDRIANFGGGAGDAKVVVDCLHAALLRNYPGIERADVADLIDLGNMDAVMEAVMKRSGLVSAAEAETSGKPVATSL